MFNENTDRKEWAVILGGSKGLGLATAKKLAKHGLHIICFHRDRKGDQQEINTHFEEIKNEGVDFLSFNIDITNVSKREEAIRVLEDHLKNDKIKVLVHSIAKGNLKPMIQGEHQLKNDDFHLTLEAMAISLYDWVKLIFEKQWFTKHARIIAFTSEGNSKALPNYAAVSAAKVALEAIIRNIAVEFAPYYITANALQPGTVVTDSLKLIPGHEKIIEYSKKRNPYGRLTTPEDVANAVFLLCQSEANWINGCVIPVNGGEHLSS